MYTYLWAAILLFSNLLKIYFRMILYYIVTSQYTALYWCCSAQQATPPPHRPRLRGVVAVWWCGLTFGWDLHLGLVRYMNSSAKKIKGWTANMSEHFYRTVPQTFNYPPTVFLKALLHLRAELRFCNRAHLAKQEVLDWGCFVDFWQTILLFLSNYEVNYRLNHRVGASISTNAFWCTNSWTAQETHNTSMCTCSNINCRGSSGLS